MSKQLTTFFCEYKILPEHQTRDVCLTLFGGMTEDDDKRELGDVKLLGRWGCVGEARGFCVAQATDVVTVQKWLNNWVTMADIKVTPCLDDNQQRELILGQKPKYTVAYNKVGNPQKPGESLYVVKYQFSHKRMLRNRGFSLFAKMTEEQDRMDSGNCTSYGRWHVPSLGCGYAVASCPSAMDAYRWAYNWNALCDCELIPVTRDEETRKIIQSRPGFQEKREALMSQMGH